MNSNIFFTKWHIKKNFSYIEGIDCKESYTKSDFAG